MMALDDMEQTEISCIRARCNYRELVSHADILIAGLVTDSSTPSSPHLLPFFSFSAVESEWYYSILFNLSETVKLKCIFSLVIQSLLHDCVDKMCKRYKWYYTTPSSYLHTKLYRDLSSNSPPSLSANHRRGTHLLLVLVW